MDTFLLTSSASIIFFARYADNAPPATAITADTIRSATLFSDMFCTCAERLFRFCHFAFRGESGREWGQKSALKVATVDHGCSFFIQRSRIVLSFFAIENGSVFRHFTCISSSVSNCISSTCSTHTSGGSSKHQPTPPSTKQKPFWFTHFHPLRPNYAQFFLRPPS